MTDTAPTDDTTPATTPDEAPEGTEPETFDANYVRGLREEAASNRVRAREEGERANAYLTALRDAAIREHARGILADPTDLPWSDDYADDTGMPHGAKITEAAQALAAAKPHLGRVRGDAGQGYRGEDTSGVDLAGLLRANA